MGDKAIKSYEEVTALVETARPNDKVALEVKRGDKLVKLELTYAERQQPKGGGFGGPGGGTGNRPYAAYYGGQRENVQAQQGPDGHEYGGVYKSTDGGETWTRLNSLNPRPMYFSQIRVDPSDDNNIYVLGVSCPRLHRRRQDVPVRPAAASTPTTTPCGSTRRTAGT
jgi:hypothetical protein